MGLSQADLSKELWEKVKEKLYKKPILKEENPNYPAELNRSLRACDLSEKSFYSMDENSLSVNNKKNNLIMKMSPEKFKKWINDQFEWSKKAAVKHVQLVQKENDRISNLTASQLKSSKKTNDYAKKAYKRYQKEFLSDSNVKFSVNDLDFDLTNNNNKSGLESSLLESTIHNNNINNDKNGIDLKDLEIDEHFNDNNNNKIKFDDDNLSDFDYHNNSNNNNDESERGRSRSRSISSAGGDRNNTVFDRLWVSGQVIQHRRRTRSETPPPVIEKSSFICEGSKRIIEKKRSNSTTFQSPDKTNNHHINSNNNNSEYDKVIRLSLSQLETPRARLELNSSIDKQRNVSPQPWRPNGISNIIHSDKKNKSLNNSNNNKTNNTINSNSNSNNNHNNNNNSSNNNNENSLTGSKMAKESQKIMSKSTESFEDRVIKSVESYYVRKALGSKFYQSASGPKFNDNIATFNKLSKKTNLAIKTENVAINNETSIRCASPGYKGFTFKKENRNLEHLNINNYVNGTDGTGNEKPGRSPKKSNPSSTIITNNENEHNYENLRNSNSFAEE